MDIELDTQDKIIRKIEDIIDIQKANGNINARQVAFKLPSETNSSISANLGKSLETGLSIVKSEQLKKKDRSRQKYQKETSDVISWPSDSDITVLRMKLCANDINDKMDNVALGDGLHQPHSSSMVNLATLMLQSQRASKHSLDIEEYLLPLTSWEHARGSTACCQNTKKQITQAVSNTSDMHKKRIITKNIYQDGDISPKFSGSDSDITTKSKFARFLRLYFCPCCTCLYKLEMQDK
ncbi:uncharacterized protein LOC125077263 [Vanessa atalanta]|uniref:uncharacterized protein LOC125077263 n=1 Tax=Vanessa atalanta TaxID=42275 RepID=UPI001FCD1C98|nr:uncharacterized protein LOC125077263 [Vanessa atalanta]